MVVKLGLNLLVRGEWREELDDELLFEDLLA